MRLLLQVKLETHKTYALRLSVHFFFENPHLPFPPKIEEYFYNMNISEFIMTYTI